MGCAGHTPRNYNALMRSGYTLEEALNFAILNRVSDDQRLRLLDGINLNA